MSANPTSHLMGEKPFREFRVLLNCRTSSAGGMKRIECRWVASTYAPPAELKPKIEASWQEALARPNVKLFDGGMCRMERFFIDGDALVLEISRTSYKQFIGTNQLHPEWGDVYGQHALANPLGVSAALISSDDKLVMGMRSERVAYHPNRVHPFAGTVEPADKVDMFDEIARELEEEALIAPDDIANMQLVGIVEDCGLRQPEVIIETRCKLSSDEIQRRMQTEEHDRLVIASLNPDALCFLQQTDTTTPGAAALIELYL